MAQKQSSASVVDWLEFAFLGAMMLGYFLTLAGAAFTGLIAGVQWLHAGVWPVRRLVDFVDAPQMDQIISSVWHLPLAFGILLVGGAFSVLAHLIAMVFATRHPPEKASLGKPVAAAPAVSSGDFRLDQFRQQIVGSERALELRQEIADTLYFCRPDFPMYNPSGVLNGALASYWALLDRAAALFTHEEWLLLVGSSSPVSVGGAGYPADIAAFVADFRYHYEGDDWNDEVLKFRAELLPRLATLSQLEFDAVRAISLLLHNIDGDAADSLWLLSKKLPALSPPG